MKKAEKAFYSALNTLNLYQVSLSEGKYTIKHQFYAGKKLIESKSKGVIFTCDTVEQLNKVWSNSEGWVILPKNPDDPDTILEYRF